MKKFMYLLAAIFLIGALISGCSNSDKSVATKNSENPKELYIYCGATMKTAMRELSDNFEKSNNCKVIFDEKGGSGELLNDIKANKPGDLFLPGSDSYIKTCLEEGYINSENDTAHVGYNKAVLFVQKGNPKNITNDLNNLLNTDYKVLIGNPKSGSIGSESEKILKAVGIYDEVIENASRLTNDSTELLRVIKDKEADLTINWYAKSVGKDAKDNIDVIIIDEKYASKKKLVIGILKSTKEPELSSEFIKYASSEEGKEIFNKYGLYDIK